MTSMHIFKGLQPSLLLPNVTMTTLPSLKTEVSRY